MTNLLRVKRLFCEKHFKSAYKRCDIGRFVVLLPMKENTESVLGSSKENAVKILNSLWVRLYKNKTNLYRAITEECEYLWHSQNIKLKAEKYVSYFIPHHTVYKPERTSSSLSEVFNVSSNISSGHSINSIL